MDELLIVWYWSSVPVIQIFHINLEISKKLLLTRRCLADLINPLFLHTWISECWDILYSAYKSKFGARCATVHNRYEK